MNILFISISSLPHMSEHSISLDLIHEFRRNGHQVCVICAQDDNCQQKEVLTEECGCKVLRVRIGKNKKANIIVKGITTIRLPNLYISAIKKYFSNTKFDLVLYPTPPVSQVKTVKFIKKRDGAKSYLLLKDIFPQNAVDIGMLSKTGLKKPLYRYFRMQEKKLYECSDRIGCMSKANAEYVVLHNSDIDPNKVEVCPNCIEIEDKRICEDERISLRNKYEIPLNKKVFVYGGNLGKPQGIPFMIEALRLMKERKEEFFLIIGDGTEYGKIQEFVDTDHPTNVKLMKRLPKADYDKVIGACDVGLIFLDHRFTIPNFPSRLLGYMQAGLLVIACTDASTDIGNVIVEGGFGLSCESNDAGAFVDAVDRIFDLNTGASQRAMNCLQNMFSVEAGYKVIMRGIQNEI